MSEDELDTTVFRQGYVMGVYDLLSELLDRHACHIDDALYHLLEKEKDAAYEYRADQDLDAIFRPLDTARY